MQQINSGDWLPPASNPSRKHQLVKELQFPPGFHFVPTDEELIDHYLRRKIHGLMSPLNVINEVDIMSIDPVKLIEIYKGYGENRWYFFTKRTQSKTKKQDEPNRKVVVEGVEEGSWSATGSLTYIRRTAGMDPGIAIGTKRVLTYRSARSPEEDKWSMHEYVMTDFTQMGQFVLCAIQLKQTYEAEKKAQEDGKIRGNKRKRRATRKGMKNMQPISQAQEEHQQETSQPGNTNGDPYGLSFNSSSMQMVCEDASGKCSCGNCQGNNGILQPADQTGNPAVFYNQQQQSMNLADGQLMNTPAGYSEHLRNYQNQFYLEGDNGSSSSGEGLHRRHNSNLTLENVNTYAGNIYQDGSIVPVGGALEQRDNTNLTWEDVHFYDGITLPEAVDQLHNTNFTWGDDDIFSGNTVLDGSMDDFPQDPLIGGVSIEDLVLCDAFLPNPGCDDSSGQSMGIQPVAEHRMGDYDYEKYDDEALVALFNSDSLSGSLPYVNFTGDNGGIPEESNQGSLICHSENR
uniref:NAC domain-containing protein n=1 Tax=Leersia perrieri TaxID=77586 RepID=A0A0D9XI66_9ORYZ